MSYNGIYVKSFIMDKDKVFNDEFVFNPFDLGHCSLEKTMAYTYEYGDFKYDNDINKLINLMWYESNSKFYYFLEYGKQKDKLLSLYIDKGDILIDKIENRYYRHPNFRRDFIRIVETVDGLPLFDWEKDVIKKGPEFLKCYLRLSDRRKIEIGTWLKVQMEESYRNKLKLINYNYHVFLSYSERNQSNANKLYDLMNEADIKVFMAQKVLAPGDDFTEEIRLAIHGSTEIWLLMSPDSIKSEWVTSEWAAAWVLNKRIIPILFRCEPSQLPPRLNKLHCIDLHKIDAEFIKNHFSKYKEK